MEDNQKRESVVVAANLLRQQACRSQGSTHGSSLAQKRFERMSMSLYRLVLRRRGMRVYYDSGLVIIAFSVA